MKPLFSMVMLCLLVLACSPVSQNLSEGKMVGDQVSVFSAATNQDALLNYEGDYYGKHHLILTFFPAAFTPV